MADIPVLPLSNYGQLLGSYSESLANQENATTNNLNAQANVAQLPYQRAQMQAQTQNVQAQTTGANIQNQRAALQIAYTQHLLESMQQPPINDQSPQQTQAAQDNTSTDPTATSVGTQSRPMMNQNGLPSGDNDLDFDAAGLDPAHVDAFMQQKYAVRNTWTPQETQQLQLAAVSGVPGAVDMVKTQHEARIQNATANAQWAASKAYDAAATIATAPDGLAFTALKQISPNPAVPDSIEKIAKQKNWTPEQIDEFTRAYSNEVGNAVHRYSGRDIEVGRDGVPRDKTTQQPLLGGVPEGMDAKSYAEAYRDATSLVDVPNSDGSTSKLPKWKTAGATSATQYLNSQQGAGTLPSRGIPRQIVAALNGSQGQGAAPGQPQQGGVPGQGVPGQQQQQQPPGDPVLRQALADPTYNLQTPPVRAGVTPTPAQLDQQKATIQARTDLLKDSQDATSAAASSLQYLNAAKAIMQGQGKPVTGIFGPIANEVTRLYGGVNSTNYQEVAKYLGNAALSNAKGIYGQRMTQSEVGLQLNELSPSTKMTDAAINGLIDSNTRSAQYTIESAQRARQYLYAGKDPQQFASFNEQYFPRAKSVNGSSGNNAQQASGAVPTATGPNGQKLYLRNGQWVTK